MKFIEDYAQQQDNPDFYRPLDAARRIAGTDSLGVDRYVVLVEGRGSPNENFLLDLKQAKPSALTPYLKVKQPDWQNDAHRLATVQQWSQAISPAFLTAVTFQNQPFVLKALQPSQDRLTLTDWNGKLKRPEQVIRNMGEILAWEHLHSGGRSESAIADEWVTFGNRLDWQKPILEFSIGYAKKSSLIGKHIVVNMTLREIHAKCELGLGKLKRV